MKIKVSSSNESIAMIELTAIDIGKARCLLNLRVVAAAFLALAMSFGLPLGAAAQGLLNWELEIVVLDGNTTYFRCNSAADFAAQTNDCSDNEATWDCNGEVIAVERDELGACITRVATLAETLVVIAGMEQIVDLILAGLVPEMPGARPDDEEGQVDSTFGSSTESFQTQVIHSTPGVTAPPPAVPPGPPETVPPGPPPL